MLFYRSYSISIVNIANKWQTECKGNVLNVVIPVVLEDLAAGGAGPRLPHLPPQVVHHACLTMQDSTLYNLEILGFIPIRCC